MTILEKKPCPFCGKEPKGYPYGWYVECPECHIRINGISYENAVERWNTRYVPTCKLTDIGMYGGEIQLGKFKCSACGGVYLGEPYQYCPDCGAKVIKE